MEGSDNILTLLRKTKFNQDNESLLLNHPYVKDAESGTLTRQKLQNLVREQYFIQQYDQKSLEKMVERSKEENLVECEKFFQMLVDGEIHARPLILKMAKWLGLSVEQLEAYSCKMMAQAYPSYLAKCSLMEPVSYVTCACAVNFPTWGRMCGRVRDAVKASHTFPKPLVDDDMEFLSFFASPIPGFDEMALRCANEQGVVMNKGLETVVRLLQEAEVMFWDSIHQN